MRVEARSATDGCAETQPGSLALSPSPARIRGTLASIVDQPDDLRELRTFHRALADVNRLRIVRRLAETPSTVTELIDHVGLSQPLVSHHLKRLRDWNCLPSYGTCGNCLPFRR